MARRPAPRPPLLVALLAAALVIVAAPAHTAPAVAATGSGACASHLVPATRFFDTLTSVHRAAIDCAVWWGTATGTSPTTFSPAGDVTRGQTAAMVARLLRNTGRAPVEVTPAGFADTDGHTFEADIDLLASLGIITGLTPTSFAPDRSISRAQVATVLARTFSEGYGTPLPAGPVPFTDVSSTDPHRTAIGQLTAAGIVSGVSATRFAPTRPVSRAQLASFTSRAFDELLRLGHAELPTARPGADDAYGSRLRGAWVHLFDDRLKTRAGIRAVVDELAGADANVIIAQVARRHDAYYTSDVLPRTADPALAPGFDVLAELITAAHARGIAVHAWFGVAPTYHDVYAGLPRPDGWVYADHGPGAPIADRWVTRGYDGVWSTYLDPGVPAVQDHVAAVVGELAADYDLDAVHLDYVRYENAEQGYNPAALAAFRAETGRTGTPTPTDDRWTAWRREQTRRVILAAGAAIEATGNDVELSAAVITWGNGPATPDRAGFRGTLPYTRTLQDWDGWVRRGEVDAVMPMNYFRARDGDAALWFARWITYERALAVTEDAQVVPGPAGYLNAPADVLAQVRAASRVDGAVIYSYQQPTLDHSRGVWAELAGTRWGYAPVR